MDHEVYTTLLRLGLAVFAGGLIGFERSYHGRPAGFRTHTLVCVASSLLMLLSAFQWQLVAAEYYDTLRVDPTRMSQGIMTGIGFLGAGVILKDDLTIRGLTTAASIWLTASIGVCIGMGFYFAAMIATLIALGVLILFRKIERIIPTLQYAQLIVRLPRHEHISEEDLRETITSHDIRCAKLSYQLENEGKLFQYQVTINTTVPDNFTKLANTLTEIDNVIEFSLVPTGD